jgi:hypothetical protein
MRRWMVVFALAGIAGCTHASDIEIRNPMTARAVDQNRIVKPHDYIERERGLPPGSVADEAQLLTADAQQVCFAVTLRETDPIDLSRADVRLSAPKLDALTVAQVWPEAPTVRTFNGRIPERHQTGMETVCTAQDQYGNCRGWQTRPIYSMVWVPGPVSVYEARGRMCFQNRGVATPATQQLSLELRLARVGQPGSFGLFGTLSKRVVFRWGFLGAVGAVKS